jgi:hypothetical protein
MGGLILLGLNMVLLAPDNMLLRKINLLCGDCCMPYVWLDYVPVVTPVLR